MEAKREQVFVGLFVIIAVALLIATVFSLSGAFAGSARHFHAKFHNAAGLERGTTVRYEGGPKIGRVEKVMIDPKDPTVMDMEFSVKEDLPIKTDSRVAILSFSPLGDNHLEVRAGSPSAPRAAEGAILPSDPYVGFNDLTEQFNRVIPQAQELMGNLNLRVKELSVTLARVNDLLSDQNRANISATVADLHGMLQEDRPLVHSSLGHVNDATAKLGPIIDQFHKTASDADDTIQHVDAMIGEDRPEVHQALLTLHQTLDNAQALTAQLNRTLDTNSENLDEIIDNLRHVTENLNSFTETIKTRPYTLIRASGEKPHNPGESLPK